MKNTFSILILIFFSSCIMDKFDGRFKVVNNTEYKICVETAFDTIPDFPSINKTEFYLANFINIHDTVAQTNTSGPNGWSEAIQQSKNKKLNLFIFNIDSLKTYNNIDTLIKKRIYKRLEYSEQELEKNNWIVKVKN